ATTEWCVATSRIDGLHIRERATSDARSFGLLNKGGFLYAYCNGTTGAPIAACGGLTKFWVAVWYDNRWGYVPTLCVDWRRTKP
ncbi:MAG: hypothetical protein M3450_20195, partial [Actinomycetota bacterium]|nr:hypothetical protein [Actinomycetota bacterium]